MNEYDEIAAGIIDLVLDVVLEQNSEIYVEQKEGNTLIYGEPYYRLEEEIADKIMENISISRCTSDDKDKLLDQNGKKVLVRIGGRLFTLTLCREFDEEEFRMLVKKEHHNI